MAKDLRSFVQTFNMSRKFTDQDQPFDPDIEAGDLENQRKRRSDWTEYMDPEDYRDDRVALQEEERGGDDLEPKIVTELPPKEKFKRPKLNNCESGEDGDGQFYKPVFSKRNSRNDLLISQDDKAMPIKQQQQAMGDITTGIGELRDSKAATAKGNSKWRDYITEQGDFGITNCWTFGLCTHDSLAQHRLLSWKLELSKEKASPSIVKQEKIAMLNKSCFSYTNFKDDMMKKWGDAVLETESNYQMVEDDIHPDFI
ncbi:hypothetical protein CCACVL1_03015 [Corchorus capsularis]|uniref:Uncharacterized protein n=1 Tax=Corchorus capsularis TaxID=210143 RepID=A0A1R3K3U8_COCAP|nr:hypothetical protein CCACVL1_03015 [Corchorus capsularis]